MGTKTFKNPNRLFWDVDVKKISFQKDRKFIISRVLMYGDENDFDLIRKRYNLGKIKETAKAVTFSDRKSIYFWSAIFNIPLNQFKCFRKLSQLKPSAFWQR